MRASPVWTVSWARTPSSQTVPSVNCAPVEQRVSREAACAWRARRARTLLVAPMGASCALLAPSAALQGHTARRVFLALTRRVPAQSSVCLVWTALKRRLWARLRAFLHEPSALLNHYLQLERRGLCSNMIACEITPFPLFDNAMLRVLLKHMHTVSCITFLFVLSLIPILRKSLYS